MSTYNNRDGRTLDEIEPPYDNPDKQPKTLTKTRHIDDVLYVAGRQPLNGTIPCEVMLVTTAVDEDEASQQVVSTFGFRIPKPAEYLNGPTSMIKDVALGAGLDLDKCYYTALCKWLLPRTKRSKPPVAVCRWGLPILEDEIRRVKPKIIVCLGKQVFDLLSRRKIGFDDAHGGWFWSQDYEAHIYVMNTPQALIGRPEIYETFRVDFMEVARKLRIINDVGDARDIPVKFEVLRDEQSVTDWVDRVADLIDSGQWPGIKDQRGRYILSTDGEWHRTRGFVDAQLRTFQFAWTDSEAVIIEFRDENNRFTFELDDFHPEDEESPDAFEKRKYKRIGQLLAPLCERQDVVYIGHHFAADAPMLNYWLGLSVFGKCTLDTEFAQQTIDESSELDLERGIAMKYTTLGYYSLDLILWKRENKSLCEDGYGYIPSKILYPYAANDVIAPVRAYPYIRRQLVAQALDKYYDDIFNPFVTDVFVEFAMVGLPVDSAIMDRMSLLYHFVRDRMDIEFRRRLQLSARAAVIRHLDADAGVVGLLIANRVFTSKSCDEALDLVKQQVPLDTISKWSKILAHLFGTATFKHTSAEQMRRWLFDVEGMEPIKTTNQKAKGLPSMPWSKVLDLPLDRQKMFTPATDKQTLSIIAKQLPELGYLMDLKMVNTLCTTFLKEANYEVDENDEESEVLHGLRQWVASDGRIHGMMSTTETGRPRAWAPNILNWPSFVNERIGRAVKDTLHEAYACGELPEHLVPWLDIKDEKDIPSIRSVVTAPSGWCLVESDYKTAEMVGLGFISGDDDLLRILRQPDPEWVVLQGEWKGYYTRIKFDPPEVSGIPLSEQDPKYLMHVWKDGECLGKVEEHHLARNPDGSLKHRGYDIHWMVVEMTYERPRESMKEKVHRNAGKVLNFCVSEDELVMTDRGEIPIQEVSGSDLLWDGVEWVSHEGVSYSGEQEVVFYGGLWATKGHNVWLADGRKVQLERARMERARLCCVGGKGQKIECGLPDCFPRYGEKVAGRILQGGCEDRQGLPSQTPGSSLHDEHVSGTDASGILGGGNNREIPHEHGRRKAKTYDIINAGPRNRFVCSGVLVSNSSIYGASPNSLDRKIEADTGVKPPEGTGQKGLDAIARRQPRGTEFMVEMENIPKTRGSYRAASGRVRHCMLHGSGSGVGWRTRQAQESGLGREMKNFPMQESVASTSARACRMARELYSRLGLRARVMVCLYDSLVTLCPLEERFVVSRIHSLVMSDWNVWEYDDGCGRRRLQYEVDNEFNYRWSTQPDKAQQAQLDATEWHPTPDSMRWMLTSTALEMLVTK